MIRRTPVTLLERIRELPVTSLLAVLVTIVGFAGAFATLFLERFDKLEYFSAKREVELQKRIEMLDAETHALKAEVRRLRINQQIDPRKLEELLAAYQKIKLITPVDTLRLAERVNNVEAEAARSSQELDALKKAMNPTDPKEILTVARLGDKFDFFKAQLSEQKDQLVKLEKESESKIERNYQLVDAQVDRIIDMLKWLGVLLIPIVLNTLRDLVRRPHKDEQDDRATAGEA